MRTFQKTRDDIQVIFISHSSADAAFATDLRARLLARGYDPSQIFLDSDREAGIVPGAKWDEVLYERLKDCRALLVLCSPRWETSKWCFAELVYAKVTGKEIFPVVIEACDLGAVASAHQAVVIGQDGDGAWQPLWAVLESRHLGPSDDFGWPPKEGDRCPYPGLLAFDERYAGVYFGREKETQTLLEELRKMRANGEPRLLMIVGSSGSGKSSLLKAGVLPQLGHKSSDSEWLVLPTLRYGETSDEQHTIFDQLAMNVVELFRRHGSSIELKPLRDAIAAADANTFVDALKELSLALGRANATVIIPIDQFEELLASSAGPAAARFLEFLHAVLACRNGRLLAIGTMRSDHLDLYERTQHALAPPFFQSWRLGPFPRERIRDVIVKPAQRAHVVIDDDLLARLEEKTPTAEALPLLAFTLEKLFRKYAGDGRLELAEYLDLGEMEGAIQKSADAIAPRGSLPPEIETALRLAFVKYLAEVNSNDEVVRKTALWSELPAAAKPLLEQFVNERLLVKSDHGDSREGTVEVAHEAMFRAWPQLRDWLRTSADILRWRRDVDQDRRTDRRWRGLRPAQLAVARKWPQQRRDELTGDERQWIRRAISRERAQRLIVAAVMLMIAGLSAFALWETRATKRANEVSLSRVLAWQSAEVRKNNPRNLVQSFLLAIEGYRRDSSVVTADALWSDLSITPIPIARFRYKSAVTSVRFSRDGKLLAAADEDGRVAVWDYGNSREVAGADFRKRIGKLVWNGNGTELAAALGKRAQIGTRYDEVAIWEPGTGQMRRNVISSTQMRVLPIRNSSDAWLLVVLPGALTTWSAAGVNTRPTQIGMTLPTVNATGSLIAYSDNNTVHVIETATGKTVGSMAANRMTALAFNEDDDTLAIGGDDGITRVWKWKSNTILGSHRGYPDVTKLAFCRDGRIAEIDWSEDEETSFYLWFPNDDMNRYTVDGGSLPQTLGLSAQFTNDGEYLVLALNDASVRVLKVTEDSAYPILQFTAESEIRDIAVDPTGRFVAVGSADGTVTVWNLISGKYAQRFPQGQRFRTAPKQNLIAIVSKHPQVASASTGETIFDLGHEATDATFSPDGSRVAFASARNITVVDLGTKTRHTFTASTETGAMTFAASGLLVAGRDGIIRSLDPGSSVATTLFRTKARTTAPDGIFSADGRFFADQSYEQPIGLYRVPSGFVGEIPSKAVTTELVFSPNGEYLAGHADDKSVSIWRTRDRQQVLRASVSVPGFFPVPGFGTVRTIAFDSAGTKVAVTDGPRVRIFDLQTGRELTDLLQNGGDLTTPAFTHDGSYVAAYAADNNVPLWRVADGTMVMTVPQGRFVSVPTDIAFTPDDRYLLLAVGDVYAYYWHRDDLLRESCRHVLRKNLDRTTEWKQFLKGETYRVTCDAETLR